MRRYLPLALLTVPVLNAAAVPAPPETALENAVEARALEPAKVAERKAEPVGIIVFYSCGGY
jgi:hypothetical protein